MNYQVSTFYALTPLSEGEIDKVLARLQAWEPGQPPLNGMVLVAPDGTVVEGAGEGELQIRGPGVTPGYFENPKATAEAFAEGGWLRSGDVARRDEDGYYAIVDRIKDMYISGGENVYPAEVEKVLVTHPAVLDAVVLDAVVVDEDEFEIHASSTPW